MQTETAQDIWKASSKLDGLVVPFSIGWRADGRCVMGRGIAAQAVRRFYHLPKDLGLLCQRAKSQTPLVVRRSKKWGSHLFLIPIRRFNELYPYAGWRDPIDDTLIVSRLGSLMKYIESSIALDAMPQGRLLFPSLQDELEQSQSELWMSLVHRYVTYPNSVMICPPLI